MIAPRTLALLAGVVLVGDLVAVATIGTDRGGVGRQGVAVQRPTDPSSANDGSNEAEDAETLDEQLDRVLGHVERLRGLAFQGPPDVRYASRAELRLEVEAELEAYTTQDASLDERLLTTLAQIPVGTDLRALLITAYGEQVAGYYDPESAELVVGTDDPEQRVGRFDEITLAHELAHALVDARVGLPDLESFEEGQEDALVAAQALVEGDATALMNEFTVSAMSPIDQMLLAQEALDLLDTLESFTELPWVLQRSLEFPYVEGLAFVESLLSRGGWEAVDAAYAAPPTTTLEILAPEQYGQVTVRAPDDFGRLDPQDWVRDRTLGFGAFDLQLLLEAPAGDPDRAVPRAAALATSWRGGALRQWSTQQQGTTVAFHVTHDPGIDLCAGIVDWHEAAFPQAAVVSQPGDATWRADGPDHDVVVACDDGQVRVALAPTLVDANRAIGG